MQNPSQKPTQLIPLADAAHQLGVAYLTGRDKLFRGELEGIKRRGRWFVQQSSIDALKQATEDETFHVTEGDQ